MNKTSSFVAALALAASGAAFAQGTPPNTSSPNPATAAGTQNPAGGPMGTTGTIPENNAGSAPSSGNSGMSSAGSASTGRTNDANAVAPTRSMRPARADRN